MVDFKIPGMSAMSEKEARAWSGKIAEFSSRDASFDGEKCSALGFKQSTMLADDFTVEYMVSLETLGVESDSLSVIEFFCDSEKWQAPVGTVFKFSENRLLFLWDGVWFFLEKQ